MPNTQRTTKYISVFGKVTLKDHVTNLISSTVTMIIGNYLSFKCVVTKWILVKSYMSLKGKPI